MVDGGWGVLQDPNTIWIGHHLGFRAFGLAASPNRGRRPSGLRITRIEGLHLSDEHWTVTYRFIPNEMLNLKVANW